MTNLQNFTDDELITEIENRGIVSKHHEAEIRLADFGMKHTLRCPSDKLACPIHVWLNDEFLKNKGMAPMDPGKYTLREIKGKITVTRIKK